MQAEYPVSTALHGTVGRDSSGRDKFEFGARAALVWQRRVAEGIADFRPTPGGPWTVKFEPTPYCNLSCHTCPYGIANEVQVATFAQERRLGNWVDMGLSKIVVMNTLDDLEKGGHTKGICFSGGGEPLAWPAIHEAIRKAGQFADVFLQTNGTLLDRLILERKTLEAIRLLSVSIYGIDNASYGRVTSKPFFDRVQQNVVEAVRLKRDLGLELEINTKILITPRNYWELPGMVSRFREIGVDTIAIRETQNYNIGGIGPREESVELEQSQRTKLRSIIEKNNSSDPALIAFAKTLGGNNGDNTFRPTVHCYNAIHSHFASISPEGKIHLGDPDIGVERLCIGNLNLNAWRNIWGGQKHLEVIRAMDEKQKQGQCRLALCRHHLSHVAMDGYLVGDRDQKIDESGVMNNLGSFL